MAATTAGAAVTCAGRSMEPTVAMGEQLRVFACSSVHAGDVVLFEDARGEGYILHRVICCVPGTPYVVHIGDAGRRGDPGITTRERIVGRSTLPRRRPSAKLLAQASYTIARATARKLLRRQR